MNKVSKIALFMSLNQVMAKYDGILNLFKCMKSDPRYEVHILYTGNVPDSVMPFIRANQDIAEQYSLSLVNSHKYDAIITIDPYFGPHCKGLGYSKWNTKIIYKEYGVTGIDGSTDLYHKDVYNRAWRIITDTNTTAESISSVTGYDINNIYVGNPVFDYPNYYSSNHEGIRVIWSPHCSICNDKFNKVTGGRYSTFLTYKDLFIHKLPEKYPEITFILKLHPFMQTRIDSAKSKSVLPKNFDYDEWKREVSHNHNVQILTDSDNYHEEFMKSDAIMNDSISFIAEYLATMKPMLILRDDSSDYYSQYTEQLISDAQYEAHNESEICEFLDKLVARVPEDSKRVSKRSMYLSQYADSAQPNSSKLCDLIYRDLQLDEKEG